jgi:hypothetical protein
MLTERASIYLGFPMRMISRQFITYGELLCFLLVWLVGLVLVFADGGVSKLVTGNNLAATNNAPVNGYSNGDYSIGRTTLE